MVGRWRTNTVVRWDGVHMGFAYAVCAVMCVFIHYELCNLTVSVSLPTDRAGFEYTDVLVCHATRPARHLWMLVPPHYVRCNGHADHSAGSGPFSEYTNPNTGLTLR
jgi:hypothetical protein